MTTCSLLELHLIADLLMTETALDQFWQLIGGAIALRPHAFEQIHFLPLNTQVALLVAFLAGLSQGIGQGIVLFVNRVKPVRFGLSLVIGAILYAFSYVFWALSTWLVIRLFQTTTLLAVVRTLGLAYAPLLLSFLAAIPYFGVPVLVVLSLWSLLAFVVGLKAIAGLGLWSGFVCAALGWAVFQVLQRTIGRPIAKLGQQLKNIVAGVELVTDLKKIEQIVYTAQKNHEENR
ncbi:MAG: hypothetical protein ACFB4I_13430 [Cyanophyceae cyanobacterium]